MLDSKKVAFFGSKHIYLKKGEYMATDYNNINNIIITNNNNVSNDCDATQSTNNNGSLEESLRSSFESLKREQKSGVEGGTEATRPTAILPKLWDWIKIDLFDNSKTHKAKHKLSISICKQKEIQRYRSLNNSPFGSFKRGFEDYRNDPHYNLVRDLYHELKKQGYRPQVSKCFKKGYKGKISDSVFGLSTILCSEEQERRYTLALVAEEHVIWLALKGDTNCLTQRQRDSRMIATGSIMQPVKPYGGARARDLLF
jgi:hypothetical protein